MIASLVTLLLFVVSSLLFGLILSVCVTFTPVCYNAYYCSVGLFSYVFLFLFFLLENIVVLFINLKAMSISGMNLNESPVWKSSFYYYILFCFVLFDVGVGRARHLSESFPTITYCVRHHPASLTPKKIN